jgi:CrcB protein
VEQSEARRVSGSRDWLHNALGKHFRTVVVNVTGCLVIGLFAALTDPDGRWLVSPTLRQFFMIGICGGYTTFSSFSLQTLSLAQEGEWVRAVANSFASLALCLLAVWLGYFVVTLINKS